MNNMAMVNMNNLLNIKDSRWLQLEVCREFQRNKCTRPDTECKFAHPPANVEVQNGRVTACYDSIKGRCNREKPPCKYFHPPLHLKDQLLINGRNHLALKNALMQQMGLAPGGGQPVQPVQPVMHYEQTTNPYLGQSGGLTYNPYFGPTMVPLISQDHTGATVVSNLGVQQTVVQQKNAYPGMVAYGKRPNAGDKGVIYQPANNPSAAAYHQLMQLQQPFVPVSSASIQQQVQQHHQQQQQQQHQQQQVQQHHNISNPAQQSSSLSALNSSAITAVLGGSGGSDGVINGSVDSGVSDSDSSVKRVKTESSGDGDGDADGGQQQSSTNNNNNINSTTNNNQQDQDDQDKSGGGGGGESAIKRMRVNSNVVNNTNSGNSAAAVVAIQQQQQHQHQQHQQQQQQNNAAYVAAAQSYHNALAAFNYTGVALQTNKQQQQQQQQQQSQVGPVPPVGVGVVGGYPGAGIAGQYNPQQQAAAAQQAAALTGYQQQSQQQQLLSQYQAMAAALAANQSFQSPFGVAGQGQVGGAQAGQQQAAANMNMNLGAQAGLNPFAAMNMNPQALALAFPQLAAQRAGLLQNQQNQQQQSAALAAQFPQFGGLQHAAGVAGLQQAMGGGGAQGNPGFANPFGIQFGGAGLAGNQQAALLAQYAGAQYGRGVAVSGANSMNPGQFLVGNPAVAGNQTLQTGVKRMRPA